MSPMRGQGIMGALCQCCQSVIGRPPTPAAYRWIHQHGDNTPLCVSCCAIWRANAKDDPSLLPQRIETLPQIPVSNIRWEYRW